MKKYGKIIDYNGCSGEVVDSDGNKYLLLEQNIRYDNPKVGDYVSFKEETYKTEIVERKIATFVTKVKV